MMADNDPASTRMYCLISLFHTHYSHPPSHLSISPGRVNLIGEHIDYSDFAVLPMAIEHSAMIAFSVRVEGNERRRRVLRFRNRDENRFSEATVQILEENEGSETFGVSFDRKKRTWEQYFLAGYVGVIQAIARSLSPDLPSEQKTDLFYGKVGEIWDILVDGNVPVGSGLSSSSAFVCSSAVAVCSSQYIWL